MTDNTNPYEAFYDIEDVIRDYVEAHPQWRTQPSGVVIEEIGSILHRLWTAASGNTAYIPRRPTVEELQRQRIERERGPDDIPF